MTLGVEHRIKAKQAAFKAQKHHFMEKLISSSIKKNILKDLDKKLLEMYNCLYSSCCSSGRLFGLIRKQAAG